MILRWVLFLFAPLFLSAGSIRLINNAPYDLRVVIRGADGSFLGEVVVLTQKESTWTDTYGQYGTSGGANADYNSSSRSKTPYTTLWYCMDGGSYAVCDTVSTGAVVTAQGCAGPRMCKPKKQQKVPQQQEGQYLYRESEPAPLSQ